MAVVVPFPAGARVGQIRKTASRIFHSRTDRVEAEVRAFHREVCAELDYLAAVPVHPGGSAA